MKLSAITAGEVLEVGDLIYINQRKAYKLSDTRQVIRGVVDHHKEIGDQVDICVMGLFPDVVHDDKHIGTAGEDLIAGGIIERRANGVWYNKKDAVLDKPICRFFIGEDLTPTEEPNNRCRKDGGNCNDPTNPCMCHYQDDNY